MVKCKSGNHEWLFKEDAEKCCNGYRRVCVMGGDLSECNNFGDSPLPGGIHYGYKWVKE